MITNIGKNIIGKYLLGQAPAYASYIAVGCGPQPLGSADPYGDYSAKQNLDFEMFRVPVSSRGFVTENNITKLVLTAELPTEERYEITEVGLYSAGTNPSAGAYDSKTVFAFTTGENWQYHSATSAVAISSYPDPLDETLDDNVIEITDAVFQTNADNAIFYKTGRADIYERCRFFNNIIMIKGDTAELTSATSGFTIVGGSDHIHLTGLDVDFTRNSPTDELRLAFSIINKDGDSVSTPDKVKILLEFADTEGGSPEYARFEVEAEDGVGDYDFAVNRYYTIKKQLQQLIVTNNFTWDAVTVAKIYASTEVSGTPSDDYYVALDAFRLENVSTNNTLYGMTGYTVVKNTDAETVIKSPNTSNYIEFRFTVGVS
ncbi:hypothetical protein EB001_05265 [bacterium]|jgi:hypothetical protein|nr:hypothetical protein [bacterium]